jgi:uncharacterized protein (TIGR02145 family)
LKLKGVKYCIYSGDVNQDGLVDSDDMVSVTNDNAAGLFGIGLVTDLTGDGIINSDDMVIVANNNAAGIYSTVPPGEVPSTIVYEGQTYHTILIGTQYWLKENMNVGTMINADENQANNGFIEKYCPDNNLDNCTIYGGFYQWDEAMQYVTTNGAKGICPNGWHIPTINEFNSLIAAVGNDGNALKEIGQGGGPGTGTNTSGFSALISGYRLPSGIFWETDISSTFWSSTVSDTISSYQMYLFSYDNSINVGNFTKDFGYGIRCMHD